MSGQVSVRSQCPALLEPLEPRLLLSAGGAENELAVELFAASPALFVENQGQWADTSIHYAFHGSGANVLATDSRMVLQLFDDIDIDLFCNYLFLWGFSELLAYDSLHFPHHTAPTAAEDHIKGK